MGRAVCTQWKFLQHMIRREDAVKFDTHISDSRDRGKQRTTWLASLNGGAGFGRDGEKPKFTDGYKGQEMVESHDRQFPEEW